jgi:hypothetical protein
MSQYVESGHKSFPITVSIGKFLRVKPTSTLGADGTPTVIVAGVTDVHIGVTTRDAFTATAPQGNTVNGMVDVRLASAQGTTRMVCADAVTLNASSATPVYSAASGKISASQASGALLVGYALEASTANNDIIEVLPL